MNPTVGLVERDLNAESKMKGKRRAVMSMGGKPVDDTLSPKSLARRTAVCPPFLYDSLDQRPLVYCCTSRRVRGLGLMIETP